MSIGRRTLLAAAVGSLLRPFKALEAHAATAAYVARVKAGALGDPLVVEAGDTVRLSIAFSITSGGYVSKVTIIHNGAARTVQIGEKQS